MAVLSKPQTTRPPAAPETHLPPAVRGRVPVAPYAAASALLLGRGRLLHPRSLRFLSQRRRDSLHYPGQRSSAASLSLPGTVVEVRVHADRHPHGHVPGHRNRPPRRVPAGHAGEWPPAGGGDHHPADRDLSRLVCPEHPGTRRYVRCGGERYGDWSSSSPRSAAPPALWAAAACFAVAAWCKETAIVTPLAIALWEFYLCLRGRAQRHVNGTPDGSEARRAHLRAGLVLLAPLATLVAWYAYYLPPHRVSSSETRRSCATTRSPPCRRCASCWPWRTASCSLLRI